MSEKICSHSFSWWLAAWFHCWLPASPFRNRSLFPLLRNLKLKSFSSDGRPNLTTGPPASPVLLPSKCGFERACRLQSLWHKFGSSIKIQGFYLTMLIPQKSFVNTRVPGSEFRANRNVSQHFVAVGGFSMCLLTIWSTFKKFQKLLQLFLFLRWRIPGTRDVLTLLILESLIFFNLWSVTIMDSYDFELVAKFHQLLLVSVLSVLDFLLGTGIRSFAQFRINPVQLF